MPLATTIEGTGEELQKMLADHPNERFRLVPLVIASNNETNNPKTLADVFAGRLGGLHGGGTAWSEDTGKAFTEGMTRKYGSDNGEVDS